MPRGTYPRTPEFRRQQSEQRRAALAERRTAELNTHYRRAFFSLIEAGDDVDHPILMLLIDRLATTAPKAEATRWRNWRDVIERGARVRVGVFPAEIFVDDELGLADAAAELAGADIDFHTLRANDPD